MKHPGKGYLLDTNVLLRYLLDDDADQSPRARRLMKGLERGREHAELEDFVLAEAVWVLEKGLEVPRSEISRRLSALVMFRGLRCRQKSVVLDALSLFSQTTCDIVDCLLAARALNGGLEVSSFDQDFKKLGCPWKEPS